jgi:IclR family transcriptional regulator, KDG regulon repressor
VLTGSTCECNVFERRSNFAEPGNLVPKIPLKMDKGAAKALRILEHLAQADRPLGVAELANTLRLSKSSVHRPLTTLVDLGYVMQDAVTARYAASLKMWEVGSAVLDRVDLKRVAAQPMTELASETGETVHLSILDGNHVVHIDKIECEHPIRAYSRIGGRVPVHCIATGKAMLAFQSEAFIKMATRNVKRATPDTVVDPDLLLTELAHIRRSGVSISRGGWQAGVDGIAAPIRDANGHVVAGVGISGPAIRLRSKECARYAPLVAQAAAKISRALGYAAPPTRGRRPKII